MEKRIETLEELDRCLSNERFDMWRNWAKTDLEVLAWKLLAHVPFNPDILIKGTREDDTPMELPDDYKESQWERYGEQFSADNSALREWLLSTSLEHVAAYTCYLVRRRALDEVACKYDPAQDHYADHWREFDEYASGNVSGHEFVKSVYEQIDEVNNHILDGKQQGLTMDEIVLHDCTWGLLPNHYDPDMITAARDMLREAENHLPDRPYIWSEQGKQEFAPYMLKYAVKRLKDFGVDIGYPDHYSIEQGYLLDYFSRLYWREAASRPEDED
jgi:hypothetical protein